MDYAFKKVVGKKGIWYLGKWDDSIFDCCVAVVGSRRMTSYGQRVIEKLVPNLVASGKTIVSGFMYGVDYAAHEMAIKCGGRTIGVLGWGIRQEIENFKFQSPKSKDYLGQRVIDSGGMLISEWEDQKGALWTFPARNKIVAEICTDVYVVEAAENSGALITAEMAMDAGKKIWAVPGPITSSVSVGTNRLIAEGKATLWMSEKSKIENRKSKQIFDIYRDTDNADIYSLLKDEEMTADEISVALSMQIDIVNSMLMEMLLKGEVQEKSGKYFLA